MGDDGSVLPVFDVKAPSSFSTEYPEDNSQVFTAQGLVEADQLCSPYGDCSKELFSDADNRDNFLVTQTDDTQGDASDSTVTKTFPEDTSDLDVDKTQTGAVSEMVMQTEEAQGDASDSTVTKTFPEDTSDLDVDKTQTGAVSESTFPDTGKTTPSIDYATQEGRNKRQLVDPSTCPFKRRFKGQTGTFNNITNDHKGDYLSAEHCPFKKRFQSQPGTGTSESNCVYVSAQKC